MPALSVNSDAKRVGIGVVYSGNNPDLSGCEFTSHMQRNHRVRTRKTREDAILYHRVRPANGFLRRLSDQHKSAVPGALAMRHYFSRPDYGGHVEIVSAGVHHRNIAPGIILGADGAGIR